MNDSILDTIKELVGGGMIHEHFDGELIIFINTAFMDLRQNGIGPEAGFSITNSYATWGDLLEEGYKDVDSVKTYVSLRVRSLFDPPAQSAVKEALDSSLERTLWRLRVAYEIGV